MEDHIRHESRTAKSLTEDDRRVRITEELWQMRIYCFCGFCTTDLVGGTSTILLKQIVELYLTVQEFSFTSLCLEKYKQSHKTSLSKKKSIRSELNTGQ